MLVINLSEFSFDSEWLMRIFFLVSGLYSPYIFLFQVFKAYETAMNEDKKVIFEYCSQTN